MLQVACGWFSRGVDPGHGGHSQDQPVVYAGEDHLGRHGHLGAGNGRSLLCQYGLLPSLSRPFSLAGPAGPWPGRSDWLGPVDLLSTGPDSPAGPAVSAHGLFMPLVRRPPAEASLDFFLSQTAIVCTGPVLKTRFVIYMYFIMSR